MCKQETGWNLKEFCQSFLSWSWAMASALLIPRTETPDVSDYASWNNNVCFCVVTHRQFRKRRFVMGLLIFRLLDTVLNIIAVLLVFPYPKSMFTVTSNMFAAACNHVDKHVFHYLFYLQVIFVAFLKSFSMVFFIISMFFVSFNSKVGSDRKWIWLF